MAEPRRKFASQFVIYGLGACLLATIVAGTIELVRRPRTKITRVMAGKRDEVYYYHAATPEEARALGEALRKTGFFNDRGTTVLLSKGTAGTIVSFVLNDGGWDHADTVYSFEEIGRRVAGSIGGFPIKVRLIDSRRQMRKELSVGRTMAGTKDAIYYFGSATEADAESLGKALRSAGYLQDHGVSVVLSKDADTTISFVVNPGVWDQPGVLGAFERMVRVVAPSVGGLPIQLRLLDDGMQPKKSVRVE